MVISYKVTVSGRPKVLILKQKTNGNFLAQKAAVVKSISLLALLLIEGTAASAQTSSNSDAESFYPVAAVTEAVYSLRGTDAGQPSAIAVTTAAPTSAHFPTIEAVAVQEPLQRTSVAVQRLWRAQLRAELNRILPTRDTPRGLVVTVPDSLLPTRNAISASTSEKLARIAEIIPPDATVRVEGYTDDLGSNEKNQDGSCGRAEAVRDELVANDNASRSIPATGFVSSAAASRASRRVEIVISGNCIGQMPARAYALASRRVN